MEEAASMKLKHSILGLLLLFTLIPLGIFGIFSIYETNRKIDDADGAECAGDQRKSGDEYQKLYAGPQ